MIVLEVDGTIVGSRNTVIDGKFKSYLVPASFATSEKCFKFGTANCAIMVVPHENFNIWIRCEYKSRPFGLVPEF